MQLHKRFSSEQVKAIFSDHLKGLLTVKEALQLLEIGKGQFFALLKEYREKPKSFSLSYVRHTPKRIGKGAEDKIQKELVEDHQLVQNPKIPITTYNYSAIRDNLRKKGVDVSVPTIISRAKKFGFYQPKKERQHHDREVITTAIGALVQHDASHHLEPLCQRKMGAYYFLR